MPRYRLLIEFHGGPYVGWQRQRNGWSIQEAIEKAIKAFSQQNQVVHSAGRTDAGVHALGMTAHVDLDGAYPAGVVRDAINYHLKEEPISILDATEVDDDFHARFSCKARHYEYVIVNRRAPLTHSQGLAWRVSTELDEKAMDNASKVLLGKHDFSTFRAAQCQANSPIRTLSEIAVHREGVKLILTVSAPSFLHHQVRSITGSLVQVGKGKWTAEDLRHALDAASRAACGPVAPADGLYFVRADY